MHATAEQLPQHQQHNQLDHELRIRTDTETWLAETLNGNMRTSFEFSFDGEELYGEDGGALTEVFDDSIQEAEIIAQQNPGLLFELRRRLIERGELEDMKAMGRGELQTNEGERANTIVVISDFPPELMDAPADVGGYNTSRKQTMMRVITLEDSGAIKVTTQSLDQSNRQALEAVYGALGKQPEGGELLPQRVNLALTPRGQPNLINNLAGVYDASLQQQHGGAWYAGRRPADDRNTYDFVHNQQDLVDWFTNEKLVDPAGAEKLRFKVAATAEARYDRYLKGYETSQQVPGAMTLDSLITVEQIAVGKGLHTEMVYAERRAVSLGKTYSGCGASVSAEETDDLSISDQLSTLGYGNKSGSDRYGSLKFKCQNGHENERPRNKLINCCKTCGVSVKC